MKKIIALILVVVMAALLFTACKIGKCDICGKSGILQKKEALGITFYVCGDCAK